MGDGEARVDRFRVHMQAFRMPEEEGRRSVFAVVVKVWGVSPETLRAVKPAIYDALCRVSRLNAGSISTAKVDCSKHASVIMRNMHDRRTCSSEFTILRLVAPAKTLSNRLFKKGELLLCPGTATEEDADDAGAEAPAGLYHVLIQEMLSSVLAKRGYTLKGLRSVDRPGSNGCELDGDGMAVLLALERAAAAATPSGDGGGEEEGEEGEESDAGEEGEESDAGGDTEGDDGV